MQSDVIEKAIRQIRKVTNKGTINLNSNSSRPASVEKILHAGLDSIRVSINSAQEVFYNRYHRPVDYSFTDVMRSIEVMKAHDRFVSLNYFVLPGFTDSMEEFEALCNLISRYKPDFIQLRNLNMDPEWYLKSLDFTTNSPAIGIRKWFRLLKKEFPTLRFGYFNPQVHH